MEKERMKMKKMMAVLAVCVTAFASVRMTPVSALIDEEDSFSYNISHAVSGLQKTVYHGAGNEDVSWLDQEDANGDGVVNALDASFILVYNATIGAGADAVPEEIMKPLEAGSEGELVVQIDTIRIDPKDLKDNYGVPVGIRCIRNPGLSAVEFGVEVDTACSYYPLDRGACYDLTGEYPMITEDYFCQKGQLTWFGWAANWSTMTTSLPYAYLWVNIPDTAQPGDVYEISFVKEAARPALWGDANTHLDYSDVVEYINGAVIIEPESTPGDVNLDASVSIVDVIYLNKAVMGAESLTESQKKSADCNHDGEADAADSLLILKSLVDLVTLS